MEIKAYVNQVIAMYRNSIRLRMIYALALVLIGLAVIILNTLNVLSLPGEMKNLVSISGTLISSICALPIKEIVDRLNKIKLIKILSEDVEKASAQDRQKIEDLLWRFIEKNALD
ncbi:hypothetical protein Oweho_0877 [Owenweeksia hongkongensis DSM 17368]|uniref:Uncharacterized protein n=1 Tax=Owenweeksia hongkongensis (strain DSM 17368 / CIP 108786 / JCM 12287 / NRRL B-23963 / UST20020801) TaxID=926562 RepID=G8R2T3_OWEHD|nr:hypothetical protein [Owenweeksia hongkongensis]AEV31888.1 hypothetical protein Oweho_0877 [Owenweeksia hongkongensis DSM 17368]